MEALLSLKMSLEGSGQFNKGLEEATKGVTEIENKTDQLIGSLKSVDKMSLGELKRELRSLKNIDLDILPDDQITKIEQRMSQVMDATGDKMQELKARGMNSFETILGGTTAVAAGFETVVAAASLFGLEGETMEYLEKKMTSVIGVVQGLSTVYSLFESDQLKSIALNIRDMFMTARNAVSKLVLAGATTTATVATTAFGRALQVAMGPIGWVALAIGALITAFSLMGNASDDANPKVVNVASDLSNYDALDKAIHRNIENYHNLGLSAKQANDRVKEQFGIGEKFLTDYFKQTSKMQSVATVKPVGDAMQQSQMNMKASLAKVVLSKKDYSSEEQNKKFDDLYSLTKEQWEKGYKVSQTSISILTEFTKKLNRREDASVFAKVYVDADKKMKTTSASSKLLDKTSEIKALTVNITKLVEEMNINTSTISQNTPNTIKDEVIRLLQVAIADSTRMAYK